MIRPSTFPEQRVVYFKPSKRSTVQALEHFGGEGVGDPGFDDSTAFARNLGLINAAQQDDEGL
jgi:hypothetical protein